MDVTWIDEDGNEQMASVNLKLPVPPKPPTPEQQAAAIAENKRFAGELREIVEASKRRSAAQKAVRLLMARLPSPNRQNPSDLN